MHHRPSILSSIKNFQQKILFPCPLIVTSTPFPRSPKVLAPSQHHSRNPLTCRRPPFYHIISCLPFCFSLPPFFVTRYILVPHILVGLGIGIGNISVALDVDRLYNGAFLISAWYLRFINFCIFSFLCPSPSRSSNYTWSSHPVLYIPTCYSLSWYLSCVSGQWWIVMHSVLRVSLAWCYEISGFISYSGGAPDFCLPPSIVRLVRSNQAGINGTFEEARPRFISG